MGENERILSASLNKEADRTLLHSQLDFSSEI